MPAVNRVPPKKQALAGAMRITIEGSLGAWPGGRTAFQYDPCYDAPDISSPLTDNPNQCAQGYNCPPPTLPTLDPYLPGGTRWIDISAGGPNAFDWVAKSSAAWLSLSPSSGSISTQKTDQRMEVGANWNQAPSGVSHATVTVTATDPTKKQPPLSVTLSVVANKTTIPGSFKGMNIIGSDCSEFRPAAASSKFF
jgi:hypothetical protein